MTGTRIAVVAAVVWREGRLLMTQRPPGGALGLLWEFPGGKVEPGETPAQALAREMREELAAEVTDLETIERVTHEYPHGLVVALTFIRCELATETLTPGPGVHAVRWWKIEEIDLDQVLAADRQFLARWGARPR